MTFLRRLFSEPLPVGTPAPDFELPDESGRGVRLSSLRGKNVVLVFYPGDDTPTCTKQLCEFRDDWEQLRVRNIEVFGVNPRGGGESFAVPAEVRISLPAACRPRPACSRAVPGGCRHSGQADGLSHRSGRHHPLRQARQTFAGGSDGSSAIKFERSLTNTRGSISLHRIATYVIERTS